MKRTRKIIIKKGNDIKAIVDVDGKVLSNDRKLKREVEILLREDAITQKKEGMVSSTIYEKITNENQLIMHLHNELSLDGYDIS